MPAKSGPAPWTPTLRALGDRRANPDIAWVSELAGASAAEVERVLEETAGLLELETEIHRRHLEGGRDFYAQFRAPLEIYALVRLLRPRSVVETGVSSGVSSAHFLSGLRKNRSGTLYSVDLPTQQSGAELLDTESPVSLPPGRSPGWSVPDRLRTGWRLTLGPSEEVLPRVARGAKPIGLFLHDSKHTAAHLTFELETVEPFLAPGAVVLADNTSWTGQAFDRFAAKLSVRVVRRGKTDLVGLRYPSGGGPATGSGRTPRSRTKR